MHLKWKDIIDRCDEEGVHWLLLSLLSFLYVFTTYEISLKTWFDERIIPVMALFKSNGYSVVLVFSLLTLSLLDLKEKKENKYHFSIVSIFILLVSLFILVYYRFSDCYNYVLWLGRISYVDVIILVGSLYVALSLRNLCLRFIVRQSSNVSNLHIALCDDPIQVASDDLLDLKDEVRAIVCTLRHLDKSRTWSMAITAPWGGGKTSFLNLVLEELSVCTSKTKELEIIKFNPRTSRSYDSIQEDFFNQLSNVFSKYDSCFNPTLKKYMASLQLIDSRQFLEKAINFYKIWNKDDLKQSLEKIFRSLDCYLLVLIDDFDRLSKEEICEVLKLIDGNAAFPNLVFLTAYDKQQVNKLLGDLSNTKDACFIDKFFNIEYSLPHRPFSSLARFLETQLISLLQLSNNDTNSLKSLIETNSNLFRMYLPTLRDVKRYINLVVLIYDFVREDVVLSEFLLLQLMRYKFPTQYKALYAKEYIERGRMPSASPARWYLKENLGEEGEKARSILSYLFKGNQESSVEDYRHIFSIHSFDIYFHSKVYKFLRIQDMNQLFKDDSKVVKTKLKEWKGNNEIVRDLCTYMSYYFKNKIQSKEQLQNYVQLIVYIVYILPKEYTDYLFIRLIRIDSINSILEKYNVSQVEYKNFILPLLKDESDNEFFKILQELHAEFKLRILKEDDMLIKDSDVWPIVKQKFLNKIAHVGVNDETTSWLYNCIDHADESDSVAILDSDCAQTYRIEVEKNPDYYIGHFVRTSRITSNPEYNDITCEPFWEQIWGNCDDFEHFIHTCINRSISRCDVVSNFWKLYKANGYLPINFVRQGNVEDKIKHNLLKEVRMLDEIVSIQKEIDQLPDSFDDVSTEKKTEYQSFLDDSLKKLDSIPLYLKLRAEVFNSISAKMSKLNVR